MLNNQASYSYYQSGYHSSHGMPPGQNYSYYGPNPSSFASGYNHNNNNNNYTTTSSYHYGSENEGGEEEESGVLATVKSWAKATGNKLAEAEAEVWRRVNSKT